MDEKLTECVIVAIDAMIQKWVSCLVGLFFEIDLRDVSVVLSFELVSSF